MIESHILAILKQGSGDSELGAVTSRAVGFIESAELETERGPAPLNQSSSAVADLHAFRKRSGYYRPGTVDGLDETIKSLAARDVPVRLGVVEARQGAVAVWVDDENSVLGVMILTTQNPPPE